MKAMNEWNCKTPTVPSSQTKKSISRPTNTSIIAQIPLAMEATLSKINQNSQDVSATMIERKSKSMTPPFLITFEILNMNVHNCLVDSGASSNIMLYSVCLKLNMSP